MRPYTWQQSQCLLFLSMPKTRASESPGGFQRVRLGLGWPIFVSGIVCFWSSIGTSDKQPGLSFVWNLPVCLVPPSSWPCPLSHKTGHLLGGFVALYLSPSFISSKTASSHAQNSRCGPCSVYFPFPSSFWACVSHGKSQRIMPTSETWERHFLLMSPCALVIQFSVDHRNVSSFPFFQVTLSKDQHYALASVSNTWSTTLWKCSSGLLDQQF